VDGFGRAEVIGLLREIAIRIVDSGVMTTALPMTDF
jgi:hypothetical protein